MKHFFSQKQISWILVFLTAISAGLYFRFYPMRVKTLAKPEKVAALLIERAITQQLQRALDEKSPDLSADDKLKLAHEQAQRMIQSDLKNYWETVAKAAENIRTSMPSSSGRHYLLEADPYYYFYLTQQLVEHGKLAEKIKNGQYYHPLMHAPYGYWTAITWHPYIGWGIGSVIRLFSPSMEWMEALCWVPIVLTVCACFAFFILAWTLGFGLFPTLMGGLALMLSPIFIQRSGFGWYDTDPYNYIFPFLILASVIHGIKNKVYTNRCALAGGFLTGLYGLFWTGWPFILILVPAALGAAFFLGRFVLKYSRESFRTVTRYWFLHLIWSFVFAAIFLTPQGLMQSVQLGWEILRKFSLSDADVWPNIFLTVGEARGASVKKLIFLTGNYLTFAVAVWGLAKTGYDAWKRRSSESLFQWLFLFFFSVPLFILPLKTERFGILFVIALVVWTTFGAFEIQRKLEMLLARTPFLRNREVSKKIIAAFLILLIFLPLPLFTAHLISSGIKPIMDDAWYETMKDLREKTPANAIVNSWWPPGYFILSLAHRKVIADGGTQHLQESYWMARALTSENEKEAAGLFRMLNNSGNDALLFLKGVGLDISDAVQVIMLVVSLPREQAMIHLPSEMPLWIKNKFLDMTHGSQSAVPSYVLVYDDLIEQNLAVTMIARWNFAKAKELKLRQKKSGGGWLQRHSSNYAQDFVNMTDEILKYTPAVSVEKSAEGILIFPNGLMVNLNDMDAMVNVAGKGIQGRPSSLFYMKDGKLEEKVFDANRLDVSALLIRDEKGGYRAVLADARLIRSLLFRLYYLKGEGLKLFKPFSSHQDAITQNHVDVFEIQNDSEVLSQPEALAV